MNTVAEQLNVDELEFEVRRSARRRTLQLTVDRGGELILAAPLHLSRRAIREFVREKKVWIYTKLATKEAIRPAVDRKEFVSGEGFLYLGRSHRLLLVDDQAHPLALRAGYFRLSRSEADRGHEHFVRWYTGHARSWLQPRVDAWAARLGEQVGCVRVLSLGHRWGSCGRSGTLNFHWRTILLPPSVIEYLVVHELVHLREPHHTPAFWRRVEAALPDFAQRKAWLATHGTETSISSPSASPGGHPHADARGTLT